MLLSRFRMFDRKVCMVPEGLELSPIGVAYARARSCDRQSSFGDLPLFRMFAMSVAQFLVKEVSDGIIAPGYTERLLNS
jgi:phosphoribosylaminoimidazolecarboxamide formyltransferase/IMP cyclohydrolase